MTGWGQDGPLARAAGHDINYLSLTGALHAIGRRGESPVPPLNLVADLGGGAMYLMVGILAALNERQRSGRGQVIDAAIVDGTSSLMAMFYGMLAEGLWRDERGSNVLDSGAPWYDTYRCRDGGYVSGGPVERKFFVELLQRLGIDAARFPDTMNRECWAEMRAVFSDVFASRPRDEWCALLEGSDCCCAPVMSMSEAPGHPHMVARNIFVNCGGVVQPGPAPRFSRTPGAIRRGPPQRGEGGTDALREWGVAARGMPPATAN